MSSDRDAHVQALAEIYRRHFQAKSFKEGATALEEAEAFHARLVEEHGEDYARAVDRAAYRIGHG